MPALLDADEFIKHVSRNFIPVIDVRSEAEFLHAHIPSALNLPLLNNAERIIIGTTYKQHGRETAVRKGFEIVGPHFYEFIDKARILAPQKKIAIYCWRGGMRSNIMAWVLGMAGFQTILLKGGYKSFRKWCFEKFAEQKKIIIVGGKTGSGKTEILKHLKQSGEQVIDLENLACHKGSAFGSLGMNTQSSNEQFENKIAIEWSGMKKEKFIWVENESRTIGKNIIPEKLFEQMRNADVVEIQLDDAVRKRRILNEYGKFPVEELASKTKLIAKRLGNDVLKQSLQYLAENKLDKWVTNMLWYYDKTYAHSGLQRKPESVYTVWCTNDDYKKYIPEIISKANSFSNQFTRDIL